MEADGRLQGRAIWILVCLLSLTAGLAILQSAHETLIGDEMLELQTDSVSSLSRLLEVQQTVPISLDPVLYHALAHGAMKVFGVGAFGLRLPSLLGFLLMQVCLFLFTRAWFRDQQVGYRAGMVAAGLPALSLTSAYAVTGRPYGVLLGLVGVSLVAWQASSRRTCDGVSTQPRSGMLVLLAISVALAVNTHFYGILVLVPLCGAELVRTLKNRRVDWPVVVSLAFGMCGLIFVVPFARGVAVFHQNYFNLKAESFVIVPRTYSMLFMDYAKYSPLVQRCIVGLVVAATAILIWSLAARARERGRDLTIPVAEAVLVGLLLGLPFVSFLLAKFVTHTIEPRHSLPTIEGFAIVFALGLTPVLRRAAAGGSLLVLMCFLIFILGMRHVRSYERIGEDLLRANAASAALKAAIRSTPTQQLYFHDPIGFDLASYYATDPWIRSQLTLVESREKEMQWTGHDTMSLTAIHMRAFTGFRIISYDEWKGQPGEKVMVSVQRPGFEWADEAVREDGAVVRSMGGGMGGQVEVVSFVK